MRILFLTHRLPFAPNRGDRIRAFYLMRAMSEFASVSLLSLVHDQEEQLQASKVPFADLVRVVRVPRLRNHARGLLMMATSRPLTHSLLSAPGVRRELVDMVGASRPDLVVAFCSGMARFGFEAPLLGMPLVIDFVDVDSAKWNDLSRTSPVPLRWVYHREAVTLGRFEANAAARADLAIVCNERERVTLTALAPDAKIAVLQNGIDLAAFRPQQPPSASRSVVFCGVMSYEPNRQGVMWFAENVWPQIRREVPDATFTVVGLDPSADVRALGARDRSIDVVGGVPEVQPYLWQSAMAVAPILVARGVQNKVLEALAAGLPVVVSRAVWDGLPLEARAGCVSADDQEAFAQRTVDILRMDPGDRRANAGRAALERLAWTTCFAPLQSMLERIRKRAGASDVF